MKNEGMTTSVVENQTRKIPSIAFLALGGGALLAASALTLSGKKTWGMVIAQLAPTFLIMGTYNKLAKTFSAPYDEEQRLRHGDNKAPFKNNDYTTRSTPTVPITHS